MHVPEAVPGDDAVRLEVRFRRRAEDANPPHPPLQRHGQGGRRLDALQGLPQQNGSLQDSQIAQTETTTTAATTSGTVR